MFRHRTISVFILAYLVKKESNEIGCMPMTTGWKGSASLLDTVVCRAYEKICFLYASNFNLILIFISDFLILF